MRGLKTIVFLLISNTFMTFAWYGHQRFKDFSLEEKPGPLYRHPHRPGLAFFEYLFQVPANGIGFREDG